MEHVEKDILIQILAGTKGNKIDTISSWIFLITGFVGIMWGLAEIYVYLESFLFDYRKIIFFVGISFGSIVAWFFKEIVKKAINEFRRSKQPN